MSTARFSGFSKEAARFLKALKANNNREWFAANKDVYEREIKQPAEAFSAVIATDLEALTGIAHRSKVFRIHRDVRFAKDKTPYNAHLHIAFMPETVAASPPSWFFGLDTEALTLGTGIFAFDKPGLEAFRERVAGAEGTKIATLLKKLEKTGMRLSEIELKRVPSGYPQDHPQADLLRRKGLSAWVDFPDPSLATEASLVSSCWSTFKQLKPLFDLLMA